MRTQFIEQQKYLELLIQFHTLYKIPFARNRAEDAVLLQVLVTLLGRITGYFKFKTQFIDGRQHIILFQYAGGNGFDDAVGQLQVLGRGRKIIDQEVIENSAVFHAAIIEI